LYEYVGGGVLDVIHGARWTTEGRRVFSPPRRWMAQCNNIAIRCHATDSAFKGFALGDRSGVNHIRQAQHLHMFIDESGLEHVRKKNEKRLSEWRIIYLLTKAQHGREKRRVGAASPLHTHNPQILSTHGTRARVILVQRMHHAHRHAHDRGHLRTRE
jgi:hypothetical protein